MPHEVKDQDLVQRVGARLLAELMEAGNRDLATMRLDDLESEVFGLAARPRSGH